MYKVKYVWSFTPLEAEGLDLLERINHQSWAETYDTEDALPTLGMWIEFPTVKDRDQLLQVTEILKNKSTGQYTITLSDPTRKSPYLFFNAALSLKGWIVKSNNVRNVPAEFRSRVQIKADMILEVL